MAAPKFSELFHYQKIDELFYVAKKSAKLIFWTTSPIIIFLIVMGKPVLSLLYGNDFVAAYWGNGDSSYRTVYQCRMRFNRYFYEHDRLSESIKKYYSMCGFYLCYFEFYFNSLLRYARCCHFSHNRLTVLEFFCAFFHENKIRKNNGIYSFLHKKCMKVST